jgi:tetratricopeptide (TPR) repeat protein
MWKTVLAALGLFSAATAHAAWYEAKSKHFTVYADEDPAKLKQYASRLERFDAAVREARGVPDVETGASTRVTLFMLRDLTELRRIYGDRDAGVAGFYLPKASGSLAFMPEVVEQGAFGLSADNVFFHEYTHHLMLQDADRPLPTWLTEGFAEFFATPKFNPDGSVTIGAPPKYRAETLYSSPADRIPLAKMLSGDFLYITGMEFESLYGRGWLLTHLLSFDLKRRGQLTRYLNEIQAGIPAMDAATHAFGDIKALDRELNEYFKRDVFTVTTIPAEKLRLPPIAVRALPAGEAAMIPVKMRLLRGGKKLFEKEMAARARGIARKYPDEPAVQETLARAELAANYPQSASEAADRALQINPKSDEALLLKGRAMMEMAKAAPAKADWNAIRVVIGRANRLDPENAEPLVLFYRTFVAQGVRPTKNALDGLFYAVALAPQDQKLRLELIGRLIDDDRLDDARTALIPLAYSPHRGKWHDAVSAILVQVNARNRTEAKAKWQASLKYFEDD